MILTFVLLGTLFPLVYSLLASMKTNTEIMIEPDKLFPSKISFENYLKVLTSEDFHLGQMLFNSVWYTCVSVVSVVGISSAAGYAFARGEFRGKKVIFALFSALMFFSLGSLTIYPTFEVLNIFNLSSSLWGLVVMQIFGVPIVYIYIIRSFVNELPKEIDEAARIDGSCFTGIFFRIILPLLKPAIATVTILSFNGYWNSYLMPAFFTMTKPEQQTLIVGLMALKISGEGASAWNLMFAGSVLVILPVLVIFIVCNKYIISGQVGGAVKG